MTAYTVELAAEKKRLEAKGNYSEKIIYDVLFSDGTTAELFQNVETAAPTKGDVLEGTIEPSKFGGGMTFRKDKTGFGGGSGGGSNGQRSFDPAKEKRITHMHAQKVAMTFLQVKAYLKELPADQELAVQDIFKLATLIREDVEKL